MQQHPLTVLLWGWIPPEMTHLQPGWGVRTLEHLPCMLLAIQVQEHCYMAQADQIADTTLPRTTVLAWVPKNSTLLAPPLWQKLLAQVLVEALQLLQLAAELPYSQLELPTAACSLEAASRSWSCY